MVKEKRNMKLRDAMVIIQMGDRKGQKGVEVVVGESRAAKCALSVSSKWDESLMMMMLLLVSLPLLDDKPAGDLDFQSQRLGLDWIVSLSFGLAIYVPFNLSNSGQHKNKLASLEATLV